VAALRAGAGSVVVTDMEQGKLDRAVRIGASHGVLADSPDATAQVVEALGGPADVVFDCVASERSLAQGVDLLRRAGTLLIVGVPARPGAVNLPIVQDWELRVQGCAAYTERDVEAALHIATEGGIPTRDIVSATFPLAEVGAAFDRAAKDASGKVLVEARSTTV
jgi:threonine dehydrogenase-like Zn-dependent dehydrogenase